MIEINKPYLSRLCPDLVDLVTLLPYLCDLLQLHTSEQYAHSKDDKISTYWWTINVWKRVTCTWTSHTLVKVCAQLNAIGKCRKCPFLLKMRSTNFISHVDVQILSTQ